MCKTKIQLDFLVPDDDDDDDDDGVMGIDYKMNDTFSVSYLSNLFINWGLCGDAPGSLNCNVASKMCKNPSSFKEKHLLINNPVLGGMNLTCADAMWGAVYYSGGYDVDSSFDFMNVQCDDPWPDSMFISNSKVSDVYNAFKDCCEGGITSCTSCSQGAHRDVDGQCTMCPPGTYKISTSNRRDGNNIPGDIKCIECPVGSKCSTSGQVSQCEAGTYQPFIRSVDCFICPNGTYSITGASRCEICPAGTASDQSSARCEPCDPGTYSVAGDVSCRDCPPGTYSPGGGMSSCMPCLPGSYNDEYGASICKPCSTGWEMAAAGATNCTECPANEAGSITRRPIHSNTNSSSTNNSTTTTAPTPVPAPRPVS